MNTLKTFLLKLKSSFTSCIRQNLRLTVVVSIVIGFLMNKGLDRVWGEFFPQNDKYEILKNQNEQFDLVRKNLADLHSSLRGDDRDKFDQLQNTISSAIDGSKKLGLAYKIISDENTHLKAMLKKDRGLSGGFDFLISNNQSFKIDDNNVIGLSGVWSNFAMIALSSVVPSENVGPKNIKVGQGIPYTNDKGKKCVVTYMGSEFNKDTSLSKFSNQCAK